MEAVAILIILVILLLVYDYFCPVDSLPLETKPKPKSKPTKSSKPESFVDILVEHLKESKPKRKRKTSKVDTQVNPMSNSGNQFMSAAEKLNYLTSPKWRSLKQQIFKRDNYSCQVCGIMNSLECHHISYENLGDEKHDQLVTLCRECHQKIHDELGYDRTTFYPIKEKK